MTWVIVAFLIGLGIMFLEIFIPSGGVLGFLSAGFLILSVVLGFMHRTETGLVMLLILGFAIPLMLMLALHLWPRTPIGRRLTLQQPTPEEIDPRAEKTAALQSLKGATGRALTPLRPAGVAEFDGRRIDTVTEGLMIDQGQAVRVVAVQGNRVVVRLLNSNQERAAGPAPDEPSFELPSA